MARKTKSSATVGAALGFRSGLEDKVAGELKTLGYDVSYETYKVSYTIPPRPAKYTPDFPLMHNGIIIETKGRFVTADRQKHLWIKQQHPELDIRFVFSNSATKLTGQKNKEFAAWLKAEHNIKVSFNRIPDAIEAKYREAFFATLKSKPSQTTYAMWCETNGFQYADKSIPQEWLNEVPTAARMEALNTLIPAKSKKEKSS